MFFFVDGEGKAIPLAATMLPVRTAIGFSLSWYLVSYLCLYFDYEISVYLEGGIARVSCLSRHIECEG